MVCHRIFIGLCATGSASVFGELCATDLNISPTRERGIFSRSLFEIKIPARRDRLRVGLMNNLNQKNQRLNIDANVLSEG